MRLVGCGNEQQLTIRDCAEYLRRRLLIELQLDCNARARGQRPMRAGETEPPATTLGAHDKQIDAAVVNDTRRAMREAAGTVVGISAAQPETDLEWAIWTGGACRAA
jgi:hypothetical protein